MDDARINLMCSYRRIAITLGGGQSQDFAKGFNQSQTTLAKSANGGTQGSRVLTWTGSCTASRSVM